MPVLYSADTEAHLAQPEATPLISRLAKIIFLQEIKINDLGADIHGVRKMLDETAEAETEYHAVTVGRFLSSHLQDIAAIFNATSAIPENILREIDDAQDFAHKQRLEIIQLVKTLAEEDVKERRQPEKSSRFVRYQH